MGEREGGGSLPFLSLSIYYAKEWGRGWWGWATAKLGLE